jgi:hypothetical protein
LLARQNIPNSSNFRPPNTSRRGSDLGDVTTKTKLLSKHSQVREAYVTLNREQVVNTGFIHALLREKINQVKKN